ncbi:MAG: hypothetical protein L0221_14910, partial [Chloroflexi bacterium]|nr:hypothetical protein [Chloroflexota bacterium]
MQAAVPNMLLVGTSREVERRDNASFDACVADLRRDDLVTDVALTGFDTGETARFIGAVGGPRDEIDTSLASAVVKATNGNPLFVRELVRDLKARGLLDPADPARPSSAAIDAVGIPAGVGDIIRRNLGRLSLATRDVLAIAAVVGERFDTPVLRRAGGWSESRVLDALDEAVVNRVLDEDIDNVDRHRFSHALVRRALYEQHTAARRAQLHRDVAEALEAEHATDEEPPIDEIAHHFCAGLASGHTAQAVRYGRAAGDQALAKLAFDEAAAWYERALAADAVGPSDGAGRVELLLALADARDRAGSADAGRSAVLDAIDVARRLQWPDGFARAALCYFGIARGGGPEAAEADRDLEPLLEEALTSLTDRAGALRARVMAALAWELQAGGTTARGESLIREAENVARRLADREALIAALESRHQSLLGSPRVEDRRAVGEELVALGGPLRAPIPIVRDRLELGDAGPLRAVVADFEA